MKAGIYLPFPLPFDWAQDMLTKEGNGFSSHELRVTSHEFRVPGPRSGSGLYSGFTPQISEAYCAIARSLENLPMRAVFNIAIRAHAAWSR